MNTDSYNPIRALRFILILTVPLLLQGCVGIATLTRQTTNIEHPFISPTPAVGSVRDADVSTSYTVEWLRSRWGPPSSIKTISTSGEEYWTYNFKRKCWFGIIPMLIVPIPLVVPTGTEKVVFLVQDGRVRSVKQVRRSGNMAAFGLFSAEGPFATNSF